ncbi:BON domain-containing protein [Spongiibacter sp.]|uniref:BON domain-containing protein n=1 Tax=Spongiibacter sp. TaxID=2024860 RepID=UPI0035627E42
MTALPRSLLPFLMILSLSACTQILTATHDRPIEEDPGSRSLGSYIDDEIIETKATVNIRKTHPELDSAHITVTSHNGIVLLTGQVANLELREQAAEVANKLKKVRKVHNELSVGEPTSMLTRSNDGWLSTKVKSRLSLHEQLDASRIKVVTENGAVYLLGMVSKSESDIAARIASETKGVQKVVRVFEYY